MPRKYRILLAIVVVVAALGWNQWQRHRPAADDDTGRAAGPAKPATAVPVSRRSYGSLVFEPCALSVPTGASIEAQCTTLQVPEDAAAPKGRAIALNIAWLPAKEESNAAEDPVFFLAGGPGQSAVQSYPQLDPAFAELRKRRHVVLVDQRGTGKSNPLNCSVSDGGLEHEDDLATTLALTETCRDTLSKKADLRLYTTTEAVRDLDAVRTALGVDAINLVGVSYGTRVAQQYAMRHPQHTRSIVLDSVVPNTLVLGNIFARNLDDALALQFGQCQRDATCREKLGDPRGELDTLLQTLRRDPPQVRYRDAATGELAQTRLQASQVAGLVRMYAYMPTVATLLPVLIHEANQGRYESLTALIHMLYGQLEDAMAVGMQFSVVCSEDGDRIAASASDAGTVLGNMLTDFMAAQCKVWPRGQVPDDFHRPLATPVPALVLEGEYDPVTPPHYGEEVAATLPNGRLLVLRGQGHNVIGAGCMPKLFAQFVEKTDAKALDARCLDSLAYAQPFTSYNGWNP
ncbi:alpha/beta fold hydrolase [Stenotrophomonas sp. MMGLT7]|uniref:alpha/beta hydrolase n=1 Tax=Stenotrophomonas sp. MMGLT7 TaxID=2901227 RepID=UPI001E640459|nr:alpha/beta fold hydrolase [Stenotrophomonas sp. MMGLT7]MCD7099046.1 alpha/beta fold hydrolase [Stenotrophomonas sp. MMGLT7]